MERIEADATPSEDWSQSLSATCNRLSTQYLNLLRSAASSASPSSDKHDPRAGGGHMRSNTDPPPPPLAADVALSTLQITAATENICVAASQLLSLIRTLQLSLLLEDYETIEAEEEVQVLMAEEITSKEQQDAAFLERELVRIREEGFRK